LKPIAKDAEHRRKSKVQKDRLIKKPGKRKLRASCAFKGAEKGRSNGVRREKTFCPRCGSIDVFWASGLPQIWSVRKCRNCRYRGSFIVIDGKLANKLREEYARKVAEGWGPYANRFG
jgi:ribosomal protein S27AE